MNYKTEIKNGYKYIVGHLFKADEIKVGSHWICSSCGIVSVEGLNTYGSTDPLYEKGEKKHMKKLCLLYNAVTP